MSPKTTDNPKEIRLEIKLSEDDNEMLEYCAEVFGQPKAAILRSGLVKMHRQAQIERELGREYPMRIDIEYNDQLPRCDTYTARFVAEYCGVDIEEVRQAIRRGDLEASWNGSRFEIEAASVYDWVELVNDGVDELELYEDMQPK